MLTNRSHPKSLVTAVKKGELTELLVVTIEEISAQEALTMKADLIVEEAVEASMLTMMIILMLKALMMPTRASQKVSSVAEVIANGVVVAEVNSVAEVNPVAEVNSVAEVNTVAEVYSVAVEVPAKIGKRPDKLKKMNLPVMKK